MKTILKVKNMSKDYGQQRGVFDLSFSVESGEVMGFLGPNGAGKTTTIRTLMGFIQPDHGRVSIKGHNCFRNAARFRRTLGVPWRDRVHGRYERNGVYQIHRRDEKDAKHNKSQRTAGLFRVGTQRADQENVQGYEAEDRLSLRADERTGNSDPG